jgi:hypothetical protein
MWTISKVPKTTTKILVLAITKKEQGDIIRHMYMNNVNIQTTGRPNSVITKVYLLVGMAAFRMKKKMGDTPLSRWRDILNYLFYQKEKFTMKFVIS